MKSKRSKFLLALFVPILILMGLLYKPLLAFTVGETITVKTVPVDPRDLLYGDYVYLELDINNVREDKLSEELKAKIAKVEQDDGIFAGARVITVYAVLEEGEDAYTVQSVSSQKPESGIYLKGKINSGYTIVNRTYYYIDYDLNRFYVEENTGRELEKQSARGELSLVLKVAEGYALIENIIPNNE